MTEKPTNLICETTFGSHLYGTATETSDLDFKGIFLPTVEQIFLGRIPKTAASTPKDDTRKNKAGELDCEYYSLHHFLRLATQGQTVAIDMLFAPESCTFRGDYGWVWDRIQEHRSLLLSKKMNAFIGYARGQATKYSLKGSRLDKLIEFRDALVVPDCLVGDTVPLLSWCGWDKLPKDDERTNPQGIRELQIAGKWFGESTPLYLVHEAVCNTLDRYGKRANAAREAGGVDWKALSHAVRVSKELIEILTYGRVYFPLIDAPLLLAIKRGERPLEYVQRILDHDLAFVERLASESDLPDKVDMKFWDNFLVEIMCDYIADERIIV